MFKIKLYPSPRTLHRHACDACDKFQMCQLVDPSCEPDSWTQLVDPTCGPNLWTNLVDQTCGPDSWTQLVDPTHGPDLWSLKNKDLFRIWYHGSSTRRRCLTPGLSHMELYKEELVPDWTCELNHGVLKPGVVPDWTCGLSTGGRCSTCGLSPCCMEFFRIGLA